MEVNYQAAWVPNDDPLRAWPQALALAVSWIADRCREEHASAVLVTNTLESPLYPDVLARLGRIEQVTPRSSPASEGGGPVLAFVPTPKAMDLAIRLARNSSLAAVESKVYPLRGWARGVEALNLAAPDAVVPPLDPRVAEAVERLRVCGNNGYVDVYGKRDAKRILGELHQQGLLDIDDLVGALTAAGIRHEAAQRLRKLAKSA